MVLLHGTMLHEEMNNETSNCSVCPSDVSLKLLIFCYSSRKLSTYMNLRIIIMRYKITRYFFYQDSSYRIIIRKITGLQRYLEILIWCKLYTGRWECVSVTVKVDNIILKEPFCTSK